VTPIRVARLALATVLLAGTLYVGSCGVDSWPPIGQLLDPAGGIWALARSADIPETASGRIASLEGTVEVVYDTRAVPHIFASSIDDAIRALGYVVARDRLFQLEAQTRATAGRLSEWGGRNVLNVDRSQRALGLAWSAEEEFAALDSESLEMRLVQAYAEGVNAWIDEMRPADVPFEYRFLGKEPMPWEPVHSLYLMKRMGYTLTYSTHDLWHWQVENLVGREAAAALFPVASPIQEPIQPNGNNGPRYDYQPLPPPDVPHMQRAGDVMAGVVNADGESVLGSNNWAVSPSRSATGNALLAGDPHLDLTMPSIWYEVHLVVPGELDVYGVTIPGIPGIVIGFNRDVAWSLTNTGADVLDYYQEVVDDGERPTQYLLDREWQPLELRVEQFFGPHGELLAVDTVRRSRRGPLVHTGGEYFSMRWVVLEHSGAIDALFEGSRAKSVDEFLSNTEGFFSPAQNMIVADRGGNIAIRSTGMYPIRPDGGSGTEIRHGADSRNDWQGYLPVDRYPSSLNPNQGFLASANQQPVDPALDDGYLGVNWPSPWRAMRINELLRSNPQVTPEDMRAYQTDPGNAKADLFVPAFLEAAERVLEREPNEVLEQAARLLREWDRRYTKENERAVLFETAMNELTRSTWDELEMPRGTRRIATPTQAVLAQLLAFPDNAWWDDLSTATVTETRDDIMAASLESALEVTRQEYGPPESGGWRWEGIRQNNIRHILGFRALSVLGIPVQGGPGNLNPSSGNGGQGASWRMVVELGPEVTARTTYPGGQSGNPASRWYDNRIEQWAAGELEPVLFPWDVEGIGVESRLGVLSLRAGDR
jgi:penicillin amidase